MGWVVVVVTGFCVNYADDAIANHHAIFKNVGITPVEYPYYDAKTIGLDISGFLGALGNAPAKSVFLLHACAHNPTGVDPSEAQWEAIANVMVEKSHYAFFDCAYQGFASGDLDKDAWAVRYFLERGIPMLVCQVSHVYIYVVSKADDLAELCKERGVVWGASGCATRDCVVEGRCGSNQEPVECVTA
jgi:aspartate/methionine/tyrosine aminotransferase